jgi:hypothetical protein
MLTALALVLVLGPMGQLAPGDAVADTQTTGALVPGDGLGLARTSPARSSVVLPTGGATPSPVPRGLPLGVGGIVGLGVGGVGLTRSRRRRSASEPTYVLVHGDGGAPSDFDHLMALMGVPDHRTVRFDYRSVARGASSTDASRRASAADAAVALDALIRSVAAGGDPVYSIHHSKGGAVGVEMIAALDAGERSPIPGYRGAALLDPAIAKGDLGRLQRFGGPIAQIPDNGGFDPVRCDPAGCRDIREGLGEASNVEVIAVRNPDAIVTNFRDDPKGLRVYDLVDDGAPSAWSSWWRPMAFLGRIFEAHSSVLSHRAVASCVKAESTLPGSCEWTGHRRLPRIWWGRGRSHTIAV